MWACRARRSKITSGANSAAPCIRKSCNHKLDVAKQLLARPRHVERRSGDPLRLHVAAIHVRGVSPRTRLHAARVSGAPASPTRRRNPADATHPIDLYESRRHRRHRSALAHASASSAGAHCPAATPCGSSRCATRTACASRSATSARRSSRGMRPIARDASATSCSATTRPPNISRATPSWAGLIGRWANRIADARFTLDGVEYSLDRNEGANLLHGGAAGFHRALWDAREDDGALRDDARIARRRCRFSGQRSRQPCAISLDDDGTLTIEYEALTDAPTPLNLTNHRVLQSVGRCSADAPDIRGHVIVDRRRRVLRSRRHVDSVRARGRRGQCVRLPRRAHRSARGSTGRTRSSRGRAASIIAMCCAMRDRRAMAHADAPRWPCSYDPGSGRELTVSTDALACSSIPATFWMASSGAAARFIASMRACVWRPAGFRTRSIWTMPRA